MQTKKRAKSVSFGKPKEKIEESKIEKIETEVEEKEIKKPEAEELNEKTDEIAEKTTLEDLDEEPKEINLSEEAPEEAKAIPEEKEREEKEVGIEEDSPKEAPQSEEEKTEEAPFRSFSRLSEKNENKKSNIWFFIWVVLITFILGLAVITGVYYFTSNKEIKPLSLNFNFKFGSPTTTPTPIPTSIPTPTTEPADLTAYTVKILNGSGVTGEAAKLKAKLTTAGFKVGVTGNADSSDYTKTVIEAKKDANQDYIKALIEELKKSYEIEANIKTLPASDASDIIVIIGATTAK